VEQQVLTEERRRHIVERLRRDGKIVASDLSSDLDVSEDTIRRDLRELAAAGLLQRVHGGALPRTPTNPSYTVRQGESPQAKDAIARAAARLVRPGQVILLDAGTTTLQVAHHLPADLRATVVTNSPPVAIALAAHEAVDVIVAGGRLYKESLANIGAATIEALGRIRTDICFLGVAGLHPDAGISVLAYEEADVKRAMVDGAGEVVALASAEKLGTAAPYVVGPLDLLTQIVTERMAPNEVVEPYRMLGLSIVLA
jgi:DeoR/GlpR family transcriptional regulator of sugar metabolism